MTVYDWWRVVPAGKTGVDVADRMKDFARPPVDGRVVPAGTNRARLEDVAVASRNADADPVVLFPHRDVGVGLPGNATLAPDVRRRLADAFDATGPADATLYAASLSDAHAAAALPGVVADAAHGFPDVDDAEAVDANASPTQAVAGVWPRERESDRAQFRAVAALAALLRQRDGSRNADAVVLAAADASSGDRDATLDALAVALDAVLDPRGHPDATTHAHVAARLDSYHYAPAVATGLDPVLYDVSFALELAADQTLAPLDPATSTIAHALVRAPERVVDDGDVTEADVRRAFHEWLADEGVEPLHSTTHLLADPDADALDAVLLFGGFDLDPLLDRSLDAFDAVAGDLDGDAADAAATARRLLVDYREPPATGTNT